MAEKVDICNIKSERCLTNKYVEAVLIKKHVLVNSKKENRRKIIIEDSKNQKIDVFLFGNYAKDFSDIEEKSHIKIFNATVESNTTYLRDKTHMFRILVKSSDQMPKIMVRKPGTVSYITIDNNTSTSSTKMNPSTSTNSDNMINKDTSTSISSSKQTSSTKIIPSTSAGSGNTVNTSASISSSKQTSSTKTIPSTSVSGNTVNTTMSTSSSKQTSTKTKPSTSAVSGNTINTTTSTLSSKQTSPTKTKPSTSAVSGNTINTSASISSSKQSSSPKAYSYTQLANIREQMILNVYGVVKFFKPPYRTRGPDFCMVIKIVDPSLGNKDNGLICNLFMNSRESLPHVVAVGDIIRMHRLKIINYNGNLQGTKAPGFSSLVFDGNSKDYKCRSSTPMYNFTKQDEKMVDRLRKWNLEKEEDRLLETVQTLSSIEKTEYVDVNVQIVATVSIPQESCVALKVWDGTLIKSAIRWVDTDSHKFTWDADLADKAKGFLVDIWVYDDHVSSVENLEPGQYIKVCNLHAPLFQSDEIIELVVHRGTSYGRGVITIADNDIAVQRMKRQFSLVDQLRIDRGINSDGLSLKEQRQQGFRTDYPQDSESDASTTNKGEDTKVAIQNPTDVTENTGGTDGHEVVTVHQASMSQDYVEKTGRSHESVEDPEMTQNICMQESATIVLGHYDMEVVPISQVLQTTSSALFKIRAKVINFEPFVKDFVQLVCPECNKIARQPKLSDICAVYLTALNSSWLSSVENTKHGRSSRLRGKTFPNVSKSNFSISTRSKRKLAVEETTEERPASTEDVFQPPKKYKRLVARSKTTDTSLNFSDVDSSDVQMIITSPDDEPSTSVVMQDTDKNGHLHEPSTSTSKKSARRKLHLKANTSGTRQKSNKNPVNTPVYFECPKCNGDEVPILRPQYNFKVTLYDGTQVMQVHVQNEEAETFLNVGISAHLPVQQQNIKIVVNRMRYVCPGKLTTGNIDLRNGILDTDRPWLDCCIRSYYKRTNMNVSMCYKLCDTKIITTVT